MIPKAVDKMTEEAVRELLKELITRLNELDEDDSFGTEGWEHMFGIGLGE